jgi:hypothetical protein
MIYPAFEKDFLPKLCPCCKRTAIAHCWLYKEPPPSRPLEDKRKAIGEAFMHADSEDCVRPQRLATLLTQWSALTACGWRQISAASRGQSEAAPAFE